LDRVDGKGNKKELVVISKLNIVVDKWGYSIVASWNEVGITEAEIMGEQKY
jgi:hypothetical protein